MHLRPETGPGCVFTSGQFVLGDMYSPWYLCMRYVSEIHNPLDAFPECIKLYRTHPDLGKIEFEVWPATHPAIHEL